MNVSRHSLSLLQMQLHIAPGGDSVLNQMGLSSQILTRLEFVNDGLYKRYAYGNIQLEITHTSPKRLAVRQKRLFWLFI